MPRHVSLCAVMEVWGFRSAADSLGKGTVDYMGSADWCLLCIWVRMSLEGNYPLMEMCLPEVWNGRFMAVKDL